MGLLERYKKAGGFVQLLSLLETCTPQKREKFLSMISEENKAWENALKQRILSLDRILTWPPEALAEIFTRAQLLTLTCVYLSLDPSRQELLLNACPFTQQKRIKDMINEKKFTPGELNTGVEKFLTEVRGLINQNIIKLEKIDPPLSIESEIENKLDQYFVLTPFKGTPITADDIKAQRDKEAQLQKEKQNSHQNNSFTSGNESSLQGLGQISGQTPSQFQNKGDLTSTPPHSAESAFQPSLKSAQDPRNTQFKLESLDPSTNLNEEVIHLKKKIQQLTMENTDLKQELNSLRERLNKIKRMA